MTRLDRCVEVYRRPDRTAGRYRSLTVVEPGQMLGPPGLAPLRLPVARLFGARN